jgi:hypothetical protein
MRDLNQMRHFPEQAIPEKINHSDFWIRALIFSWQPITKMKETLTPIYPLLIRPLAMNNFLKGS